MSRLAGWRQTAGQDGHGCGVGADGSGIDPGKALLDGEVVEEIAGFEVVRSVEEEVGGGEEGVDVAGDEIGDMRGDGDRGVDGEKLAAGGLSLGERVCGVLFIEEDLTLKVRGLDKVAVDEGEMADAGAGEQRGGGGSGGTDANNGDMGAGKGVLAGLTDAGKEDLPGVALRRGRGGVTQRRNGGGGVWRGHCK